MNYLGNNEYEVDLSDLEAPPKPQPPLTNGDVLRMIQEFEKQSPPKPVSEFATPMNYRHAQWEVVDPNSPADTGTYEYHYVDLPENFSPYTDRFAFANTNTRILFTRMKRTYFRIFKTNPYR